MNIRRTKEQKGITLIALVVTIIVLIILAGISISLLFGKSGIITRAKKGQEIADVATAQEKLELIKSEIPMKILDGKDSTVNLNNYLEELNKDKNKKDCDVTNIEKLNDINAEITISGKYKFLAKDEENGNVKIIYLGEAGGLQISPTEATYRYPTAGTFEVINNESQGKLTVKSSNEEIAKASISGTTVTVTPQKMAGTAKIVVTSEANGKYAEGRVTHTAKVENGTILLEAEPYIGEYDGKAHDALISVTVDPKDCKLEYSLNGGKFTEVMPKVTMAAEEYTISIKASKEGYTTNAITKTVTINKQTNTNGNLTLSATSGTITYPNNGTFTVSKNVSGGALSVKSSDTSVATASISGTTVTITPKVPTTDGKKTTITVTSAATSNYEAQTATYVATIKMGTITINATAYSGKYDGKAHPALTAVSTNPTGTTIEYSLNGGTYSTTMPQVTGASEYSISIRATKAGYAKAETTKTITVGKQTNTNGNLTLSATSGTITYPNNGTFTVTKNTSGGALSVKSSDESIATASISGTTVTITPKVPTTDGKKTTITVTSAATSNYEAQTATYVATIKMGTITINATAYSGKYDGKAHPALTAVSTNPTGTTIEYSLNGGTYSTTMPQVTGASEYSISIRATKAGYAKAETTKTVTVGKQTNTNGNLTLSATSGTITYPNNGTFTVTKNTSGGALSVKSNDESIATASISGTTVTVTPKTPSVNGKQVTITVTSAATSNYEAQTATYIATVNMGKITINATAYNGKYDGKAHNALTAVSTNPTGTTIEYSLNGGTYSTTMPQVTGASEYSISIRATKAGYAKAETTKTITVGKQTNTNGNLTLSAASGTITYPNNGTFTVTKNTSGGALSVKSSDESVATASISGTTVTITPKVPTTDGKKTTITVTSAATSNYEAQTATYVATIKMGTITINATAYSGKYDGKAHPALTAVSTNPTGTTIEYSLNGGTYSTTMPQVTGASEYSISIRATKAGYAKAETTKTITVGKQTNTNGNLTLSAASGTITYPNNGTFTVTKNTSGGALSVKSSDESVATASISGTTVTITPKVPTTDGKKTTITVTSAATSNYEAQTATYVATVNRGTITINATPYNGNYDGKSHPALTSVSTNPTGTTIEYSLNGGTFGTTMPQVSSIGTYSIAIKASKTGYVTANTTITLKMKSAVYAKLYTDGTLIFSSTDYTDSSRTVSENYGDISSDNDPKWLGNYTTTNKASNIIIHDKIYPTDTNCWFSHYKGTTLDLKNLDTSNVTNMDFMFYDCSNLTSLDVSNFDTSKVTKMRDMFGGCKSLTSLNLSNFNTSNVTDMSYMFGSIMGSCSNLTSLDLSNFNTSKVTNMSGMFYGCENLTSLNVSNFNTSNVTNMSHMFGGFMSGGCSKLTTLDLRKFDTSKVTNMDYMFNGCSSLTSLNVSNFNTSNVTNMSSMFDGCRSLTSLDLKNFDTSKVINMSSMFGSYGMGCRNLTSLNVSSFDTSNVTDMSGMFNECSSLTSLNVSSFNTSKVTNMREMFCDCSNLTSLNLSNFNTSNVTNMRSMFEGCERLTSLNVSNFNTSNVTDMSSMFGATLFVGCKSLTSLDLSNFNTSKVTDMSGMFRGCSGLTSLNVSNFNTSKVTNMSSMFYDCSNLTSLNLSSFDTSNVTNMSSMFGGFMHVGCSKLTSLDLRNFDTSKVTSMNAMFDGCRNLTKIMVGSKWIINSGTNTTDMFYNCGTQTVTKQ